MSGLHLIVFSITDPNQQVGLWLKNHEQIPTLSCTPGRLDHHNIEDIVRAATPETIPDAKIQTRTPAQGQIKVRRALTETITQFFYYSFPSAYQHLYLCGMWRKLGVLSWKVLKNALSFSSK